MNKITVIRDTREQNGYGWTFEPSYWCEKTETKKLDTGDYSIKGFESKFVIERKWKLSEFSKNIIEDRFERELDRLDKFDHAFLIGEFTIDDIKIFPVNSGIPQYLWNKMRIKPDFIMKKFMEIQLRHRVKIIPAGIHAKQCAITLLKEFSLSLS